jgi:hypothetical protein
MRRGTSAGRGKGEIALVRGAARGERVDYAPCANRGGGEGHAYPEPTVRFYGTPEAGWRAGGVCLAYGLLILSLRRVWYVLDANEPTGPRWEITFREPVF